MSLGVQKLNVETEIAKTTTGPQESLLNWHLIKTNKNISEKETKFESISI